MSVEGAEGAPTTVFVANLAERLAFLGLEALVLGLVILLRPMMVTVKMQFKHPMAVKTSLKNC